jgi:hypothetical protein
LSPGVLSFPGVCPLLRGIEIFFRTELISRSSAGIPLKTSGNLSGPDLEQTTSGMIFFLVILADRPGTDNMFRYDHKPGPSYMNIRKKTDKNKPGPPFLFTCERAAAVEDSCFEEAGSHNTQNNTPKKRK